jgi:hypothetical protein
MGEVVMVNIFMLQGLYDLSDQKLERQAVD